MHLHLIGVYIYYDRDSDGNITIEPVQAKNNVSRCIIHQFDTIIEAALPLGDNNNNAALLTVALSKYKEALELLPQHCALPEEETNHFQDLIDDFLQCGLTFVAKMVL